MRRKKSSTVCLLYWRQMIMSHPTPSLVISNALLNSFSAEMGERLADEKLLKISFGSLFSIISTSPNSVEKTRPSRVVAMYLVLMSVDRISSPERGITPTEYTQRFESRWETVRSTALVRRVQTGGTCTAGIWRRCWSLLKLSGPNLYVLTRPLFPLKDTSTSSAPRMLYVASESRNSTIAPKVHTFPCETSPVVPGGRIFRSVILRPLNHIRISSAVTSWGTFPRSTRCSNPWP